MVAEYVSFLRDEYRVKLYRRAIEAVVRPGDVVVEVGSGLGTFSIFAARRGAECVYAIENGGVHHLLAALVRDHGLQDRIKVISETAERARLPEKADVLITEDFGHMLLDSDLDGLLAKPRDRFLKPGGRIIPHRIRLLVAPVECPRQLGQLDPWRQSRFGYGLRWDRVRELAVNDEYPVTLKPSQLLAPAKEHTELDTATFRTSTFRRDLRFRIQRSGTLTGLAGWFEADLAPRVTLSNRPGSAGHVWQQGLLPTPPTRVRKGQVLRVSIALIRDTWGNAFWQWKGALGEGRGEQAWAFERSTFAARFYALASLHRLALKSVPAATPWVRADRFLLDLWEQGTSLEGMVDALRGRFPREFPSRQDAAFHVGSLVERYE